jgi:methylated-DNA-[protein]-cysteine S-methyltransferase
MIVKRRLECNSAAMLENNFSAKKAVNALLVFPSDLGWMAVVLAGAVVKQLTFGHSSADAARAACDRGLLEHAKLGSPDLPLVRRLRAYASGKAVDFRGVRVDPGPVGNFQRCVLEHCRRIPYGHTASYAELAAEAGFPRAARAVGNCMAANPVPLIVPCHRVVRSDGRPGSFSAPGGSSMKRRLLEMESRRA